MHISTYFKVPPLLRLTTDELTNMGRIYENSSNGRLAAYVWMNDDTQWYAESAQPISLNIWHPLILQFNYNLKLGNGTLWLVVQGQLVAFSNCTDQRTYKPPLPNHLFGSDSVNSSEFTFVENNYDSSTLRSFVC
uniref:Uncharacterized protein n=1 Tax=Romanomermis culicivorax TaxID=13658 RepID=A0A915HGJ5_ROMCU